MEREKNAALYLTLGIIILIIAGIWLYSTRDRSTEPRTNGGGQGVSTTSPATSTPNTSGTGGSGGATGSGGGTGAAGSVSIQVLKPNGGEIWERGKQYPVRWNTTGIAANAPLFANVIKTSTIISDPYKARPTGVAGQELFVQALFPQGLPKEGEFTYVVPQTLTPGTYQLLIWSGQNCSVTNTAQKCTFDLSNGLITVR